MEKGYLSYAMTFEGWRAMGFVIIKVQLMYIKLTLSKYTTKLFLKYSQNMFNHQH